ncbi:MAG TPA: DUF2752 domain-containing protein [Firmicutes bacterium]|jgi:hypothetical protein|nr:DUF2752 domain-containing protein [Bacillota bacterium]
MKRKEKEKDYTKPFIIPPGRCSRKERLFALAYLITGLLLAYIYVSGQTLIRMPACPLRTLTGFYCAGCGSVRAALSIISGDLAAAWRFNPLAVIFFPLLCWAFLMQCAKAFCGRTLPALYLPAFWIMAFVFFILLYTIARNIPLPFFAPLRP